jgi:inorganic pyrophosphatase
MPLVDSMMFARNKIINKGKIAGKEDYHEYLGKIIDITIDYKIGEKDSNGKIFTCNYGKLPATISGDAAEINVYFIEELNPEKITKGKVIAIIKRNDEKKLIAISENSSTEYSVEDLKKIISFNEDINNIVIIMH